MSTVDEKAVGIDDPTFTQASLLSNRKESFPWSDKVVLGLRDSEINAFAGGIAGALSAFAVCPLDVAKTKLQAQGGLIAIQRSLAKTANSNGSEFAFSGQKYRGMMHTLTTIVREEGIKGLYRGVVPISVGYLPTCAIYFMVYEEAKNRIQFKQSPSLSYMASALIAGASATLATNPIWVIKTRLITQSVNSTVYTGTLDAVCKIYRTEGIKAFYAGLGPALLGLLHVGIQFPMYEKLKRFFGVNENEPILSQVPQILSASVVSKICASSVTYPHEVVRTRVQIRPIQSSTSTNVLVPPVRKYRGIIQTTSTILREEGWRTFYSGLGTNMVRTIPASAITLLSFEIVSSSLRQRRDALLNSVTAP